MGKTKKMQVKNAEAKLVYIDSFFQECRGAMKREDDILKAVRLNQGLLNLLDAQKVVNSLPFRRFVVKATIKQWRGHTDEYKMIIPKLSDSIELPLITSQSMYELITKKLVSFASPASFELSIGIVRFDDEELYLFKSGYEYSESGIISSVKNNYKKVA